MRYKLVTGEEWRASFPTSRGAATRPRTRGVHSARPRMRALPSRSDRGGSSAALVAATILVALCCASPAHALTVGFLDPTLQTQDNARFWSDMTTLRASVVRYDAYWNEIAPVRPARPRDPASPEYRWEVLDRLVVDAAAHRAEIVLTLWRTPRWARADGGRGGKPNLYSWAPRISDWRAFAYAAAVRYSGSFGLARIAARPGRPLAVAPATPLRQREALLRRLAGQRAATRYARRAAQGVRAHRRRPQGPRADARRRHRRPSSRPAATSPATTRAEQPRPPRPGLRAARLSLSACRIGRAAPRRRPRAA